MNDLDRARVAFNEATGMRPDRFRHGVILRCLDGIIGHLESLENGIEVSQDDGSRMPIEFTGYDAYDGPQVRRVVRALASRWPAAGDGELAGRLSVEDQAWLAELRGGDPR